VCGLFTLSNVLQGNAGITVTAYLHSLTVSVLLPAHVVTAGIPCSLTFKGRLAAITLLWYPLGHLVVPVLLGLVLGCTMCLLALASIRIGRAAVDMDSSVAAAVAAVLGGIVIALWR
jgi:hypothetical protein